MDSKDIILKIDKIEIDLLGALLKKGIAIKTLF
jgi:hypothetical protein